MTKERKEKAGEKDKDTRWRTCSGQREKQQVDRKAREDRIY